MVIGSVPRPGAGAPGRDRGVPPQVRRPAPAPAASAIELVVEQVDERTGVLLRRLVVDDGHASSTTRAAVQLAADAWDAELARHPEWRAPEVVDGRLVVHNDASRWFFRSPALREWRRDLVPSATALYPIQRPDLARMPSGLPVDRDARAFFADTLDSIGVRTRAVLLRDAVERSRSLAARPTPRLVPGPAHSRTSWVSLACGAAVPVLDAVRLVVLEGERPRLELVDHDERALRFARELALADHLVEGDDFRLLLRDLVAGVVVRDPLVHELGEGTASVVDAVGIFEYFSDASCVRLLRNAFRLLRPGGVLVVANMLDDRPQLHFNRRGAGWPRLHVRSTGALVALLRRAGLPLERTTISTPADGVYAVVDVVR